MKSRNKLKQTCEFEIFKNSFAYLLILFISIFRSCRILYLQSYCYIYKSLIIKRLNYHYINHFKILSIAVKLRTKSVLHSNFRCSTESILVIISHIHLQLRFLFKTCNNREGNLPVYCVKNSCWTDKKMCLLIITMIKCHSNIGFAGII